MNRKAGLNPVVHASTYAIHQWVRDIKQIRVGLLIVMHAYRICRPPNYSCLYFKKHVS
jgi:hypothetical protein